MGFTDKMRESLGAEGARIEIAAPSDAIAPGQRATIKVVIVGGTRAAHVEALVVKLIEAERHWVDGSGTKISEDDAQAVEDRRKITAGWTRNVAAEERVSVDVSVEPGARHEVEVPIDVPDRCKASSPACSHTLNVQADIKGQIDPSANARVTIG